MALPALAALPAILAKAKSAVGLGQTLFGFLKKKPKRPTYTNDAVDEQLNTARQAANATTSTENETVKANIRQGTADAINAASRTSSSTSEVLAAAAAAQAGQNKAMVQQGVNNQLFRDQRLQNLQRALGVKAQDNMQKFDYNEASKYHEDLSKRDSLIQGGLNNLFEGGNDLFMANLLKAIKGGGATTSEKMIMD